jgi:hypothetical protein
VIRAFAIVGGGTAAAIVLVALAWYWASRHSDETDDFQE